MSFKIIGIEILSECDRKHYKNLLTNHIYTFYSNYEFKDDGIFTINKVATIYIQLII